MANHTSNGTSHFNVLWCHKTIHNTRLYCNYFKCNNEFKFCSPILTLWMLFFLLAKFILITDCSKNVHICSFSGPYFLPLGPDTDTWEYISIISSNTGKHGAGKHFIFLLGSCKSVRKKTLITYLHARETTTLTYPMLNI